MYVYTMLSGLGLGAAIGKTQRLKGTQKRHSSQRPEGNLEIADFKTEGKQLPGQKGTKRSCKTTKHRRGSIDSGQRHSRGRDVCDAAETGVSFNGLRGLATVSCAFHLQNSRANVAHG